MQGDYRQRLKLSSKNGSCSLGRTDERAEEPEGRSKMQSQGFAVTVNGYRARGCSAYWVGQMRTQWSKKGAERCTKNCRSVGML